MTQQRRDPRIDHFCDQLLAQLRDSPAPLTTREVAADIGVRRIELWPVRGGLTARVEDAVRGRCIISCEGTDQLGNVVYLVAKPAPVHTIYRDLAALAARGMIQRLNGIPGSRTVRWTYLPNDDTVAPSDVDALEALLSNPAAPARRDTLNERIGELADEYLQRSRCHGQARASIGPVLYSPPRRRHCAGRDLRDRAWSGGNPRSQPPGPGPRRPRSSRSRRGVGAMSTDADHTAPDPASLSSPRPAQPAALPDTSPNLALMMALRRRRRMHHSAWRFR